VQKSGIAKKTAAAKSIDIRTYIVVLHRKNILSWSVKPRHQPIMRFPAIMLIML